VFLYLNCMLCAHLAMAYITYILLMQKTSFAIELSHFHAYKTSFDRRNEVDIGAPSNGVNLKADNFIQFEDA